MITRSLTLAGIGQGNGVILDGTNADSRNPMVAIVGPENPVNGAPVVELRDLTVQRGHNISFGGVGGGVLVARATATLTRVIVTSNYANSGGGIFIHDAQAHVTLDDSLVTANDSFNTGGVFIDGGTLSLTGTSEVRDNTPPQCFTANGGSGCPA